MKKDTLFVLLLMSAFPAIAQESTPVTANDASMTTSDQSATVQVTAVRDPLLRPYKTMLKGLDAFDKFHAMAPDAALRFLLIAPADATNGKALTLRIADDTSSVSVPVETDQTFALPRLPEMVDRNADLVLNAKRGTLRWRPDIRTPDLSPTTRRLGDLRLECEVRWVIEKDELSFVQRNYFRMVGGPCSAASIATHFISAQPMVSAVLTEGERKLALKIAYGGYAYIPPLHDKTWSNDARVELTLRER